MLILFMSMYVYVHLHVCSYSLCSRIYSDECIFMSLNAHEDMHVYTGCNTVSTDIANVLQFQ